MKSQKLRRSSSYNSGMVVSVNLTVAAYSNNLLFEFFHDALV